MDDTSRSRRHNDPPQYPASNPRYSQDQGQSRGFASGSSDRLRPPPITTSPAPRGISGPTSGYGYYADPVPTYPAAVQAGHMQYGAEYSPDQRQQQSFASYNTGIMYNVNQQQSQSNVYDTAQQFQPRATAPIQMLSDVASPYYSGEPSNATGASVIQNQPSSNPPTVFQQSPAERNPIIQGFATNITGMGSIAQAQTENVEEEDYAASSLDEAYNGYQNHLKQIFQNIRNGILAEASSSLVQVSDWLLSHVGELGLTADDESLRQDRLKLWNEFNNAWLAVLQKQKDLTFEFLQTGRSPRSPQSLIPHDFLKKMAKELIRLCDNIEKHGLVDYQYGVWEERIIDILIECVELLESDEGGGGGDAESGPNPNRSIGRPPP